MMMTVPSRQWSMPSKWIKLVILLFWYIRIKQKQLIGFLWNLTCCYMLLVTVDMDTLISCEHTDTHTDTYIDTHNHTWQSNISKNQIGTELKHTNHMTRIVLCVGWQKTHKQNLIKELHWLKSIYLEYDYFALIRHVRLWRKTKILVKKERVRYY